LSEKLWICPQNFCGQLIIFKKNFKKFRPKNNLVINSTLTTPPNSPEPEETTDFFTFKSPGGKLYHRRIVSNKKLFDWSMFCRLDVLLAIVVSNLITGAVVYVFV